MKICGDYPAYKVDARSVGADEQVVEAEFEEALPIVWRVLRKYPEAQEELEQELVAAIRKRQAADEGRKRL